MKRIVLSGVLIALAALLAVSCTSPTDAPAGRKVTTTPPPITLTVTPMLDMGVHPLNVASSRVIEITNTSTSSSATITSISLQDGTQGFSIAELPLPIILEPVGGINKAYLTVVFSNTAVGTYNTTIVVNDNPALTCELSASVQQLAVVVEDVEFGPITVGTEGVSKLRIVNYGDADAIVLSSSMQGTDSDKFDIIGIPMPFSIPAGSEVSMAVRYSPTQAGTSQAEAVFMIEYNGTGTVDDIAVLQGTGTP